ncbi:MAG: hypothetical protein A3K19_17135 [Lentisphaerae bacterium RIFOXYB12_FULL_65_16]|nr:MAG: hypothetical protein A3K18_03750 [Lentisphaerae bacterium RIFOXYA12_64_32]OGV87715.1 MAG: hypothetical protein A3K19_17135 [Lentisphaerae bacterium RIFOXYB12_FULL_65_16]
MVKTLTRHGNSHALVIEKPVMEALGITPATPLQITVSGQTLVVSPANVGLGPERLRRETRKVRERYGAVLKRLAE